MTMQVNSMSFCPSFRCILMSYESSWNANDLYKGYTKSWNSNIMWKYIKKSTCKDKWFIRQNLTT